MLTRKINSKWPVSRLSRHVKFHNGQDHKHIENPNGNYPVYGSGGIFTYADDYLYDGEGVLFGRKGTIDKPLYIKGKFWNVDTMYFVEPDKNVLLPKYLYYWAKQFPFDYYSTNTALPSMTQFDIGSEPLPLPPLSEQKRIVDQLDRELAEIDEFIADQQRLKILLKEKLDASIEDEMWNQNFDLVPLKYLASVLPGFAFKSSDFSDDSTHVPLLRGINVGVGNLKWNDTVYLDREKVTENLLYELQENDLVLGLDRPVIGAGVRVAKVDEADRGSLLVQRVARIRANPKLTSADWIQLALSSSRFKAYLEPIFTGVSVPHMSPEQLGNFKIPVPNINQQIYINSLSLKLKENYHILDNESDLSIKLLISKKKSIIRRKFYPSPLDIIKS